MQDAMAMSYHHCARQAPLLVVSHPTEMSTQATILEKKEKTRLCDSLHVT